MGKFGWRSGIATAKSFKGVGFDNQATTSSVSYSGGKAPAANRVAIETSSNFQFFGSQIWVTANGEPTEDSTAKGFCAFRSSIDSTNAMTYEDSAKQGSIYAGIFIAKASSATARFGAYHPLIGIEAWAYISQATGKVKTMIGGNFGYHTDSAATQDSGTVWRGVQIFCDDGGGAAPTEQSALCLWNQSGTQNNAINITQSGSGFTNLFYFASNAAPCSTQSGGSITITNKLAVSIAGTTRYIPVGTIA